MPCGVRSQRRASHWLQQREARRRARGWARVGYELAVTCARALSSAQPTGARLGRCAVEWCCAVEHAMTTSS